MCNEIAFRLHIGPGGDEAYLHRRSHPIVAEAGGPAAMSGAVLCPLDGERGMFTADALRDALRPAGDRYLPRSRLVSRRADDESGGRPRLAARAARRRARRRARGRTAPAHGRRAADERGRRERGRRRLVDGGLRYGVGGLLQGPGRPGRRLPGRLARADRRGVALQADVGGAMRQAGIVAAGALYALDHHVERLAEDHALAASLAAGLAGVPGVRSTRREVTTNIVVFEVADAPALVAALSSAGVKMGALGPRDGAGGHAPRRRRRRRRRGGGRGPHGARRRHRARDRPGSASGGLVGQPDVSTARSPRPRASPARKGAVL